MSERNVSEALGTDYPDAYPSSKKVYVEGTRGIAVPMREIHLSGGEPPLRVYDTSGPGVVDVRQGLPAVREDWIKARGTRETGRSRAHAEGPRGAAAGGGPASSAVPQAWGNPSTNSIMRRWCS